MPVVEGEGETYAVPVLLRRICAELLNVFDVEVRPPWRLPRGKMIKDFELHKVLSMLGTASRGRVGGVLLLLDLDDDACPVALSTKLDGNARAETHIETVVACREFEAWFLVAARSLRAHRSVADDAAFESDPELPRDAKGRLRHLMTEPYRETLHQAAFCGALDLEEASARSRSFRRLVSATRALVDPVGITS